MRRICFLVCALFMLGVSDVSAAPAQLYNKSVSIAWSVQSLMRDPDGREHGGGSSISYVFYVSSNGRLFEKASRSAGKSTRTAESAPGATNTPNGEARGAQFQGNLLIVNRGYSGGGGSGAMRAVVTFDPSFSTCSLNVTHGKEGGSTIKRKGTDGVLREFLQMNVSNETCAIRDGNPFAN